MDADGVIVVVVGLPALVAAAAGCVTLALVLVAGLVLAAALGEWDDV